MKPPEAISDVINFKIVLVKHAPRPPYLKYVTASYNFSLLTKYPVSNPELYDLYLLELFSWFLRDLEDFRALIEPLLSSGFYIEPLSLLHPTETSQTVSS